MTYRHGGENTDVITTLNNFHQKHFKVAPKYNKVKVTKGFFKFVVTVDWGDYEGSSSPIEKTAKENVAAMAYGQKPVIALH